MRVQCVPYNHTGAVCAVAASRVPRVPSLLFDCDLEEKLPPKNVSTEDTDFLRRIKLYAEPWAQAEAKLGQLVQQAVGGPGALTLKETAVAGLLGSRGYVVTLRTALGGRSSADSLKQLRHTFMELEAGGWPNAQRYLVDLRFREQFEICRPTARYARVLDCVPEVFVGAEERLLALVEVLCGELTAAFEESGTPLPPWRQMGAMLSKWQPPRSQDTALHPRPAMPPKPSACCHAATPPAAPWGPGTPRGSPFAAQARATFANISNAALSAFLPAAQQPPSGPTKPPPVNRPRSSLLAASLNGSSGPLPANISLPNRGPGAPCAPTPACQPSAPRRMPLEGCLSQQQQRRRREPSCALSWADVASEQATPQGDAHGDGRGSSLAWEGRTERGGPHWASSLLGLDRPEGGGRASYLVTGF